MAMLWSGTSLPEGGGGGGGGGGGVVVDSVRSMQHDAAA